MLFSVCFDKRERDSRHDNKELMKNTNFVGRAQISKIGPQSVLAWALIFFFFFHSVGVPVLNVSIPELKY